MIWSMRRMRREEMGVEEQIGNLRIERWKLKEEEEGETISTNIMMIIIIIIIIEGRTITSTGITVAAETTRKTTARDDDGKKRKKEIDPGVGREIAKNEERKKITINDGIEVAREIGKIGNIADDIRNLLHVLNSTRRGIAHTFLKQVYSYLNKTYASQSRDERRSALRKVTTFVVSIVVSFEIIFSHHAIANCIR